MNKIDIYVLKCPDTLLPIYVGSTSCNLKQRLTAHLSSYANSKMKKWIMALKAENKRPIISSLEAVDEANRYIREDYWINEITVNGGSLLNMRKATKKKMDGSSVLVSMRIDEQVYAKIVALAKADDRSFSAYVARLLRKKSEEK